MPPRIGDTHRNRAFMPTAQVNTLQLFGDDGVNLFTLQVVVDLRVGDAKFVLIGAPGDTSSRSAVGGLAHSRSDAPRTLRSS